MAWSEAIIAQALMREARELIENKPELVGSDQLYVNCPLQEGVVLPEIGSRGVKGSQVSDGCASFVTGSAGKGRLVSDIPSERLEQEGQTFGFEESVLALSTKGSPQQIQIRGVIPSGYRVTPIKHGKAVLSNQGSALILAWENLL